MADFNRLMNECLLLFPKNNNKAEELYNILFAYPKYEEKIEMYFRYGILTPLHLSNEDEFVEKENGDKVNIRLSRIVKTSEGLLIDNAPYKTVVRYNYNNNKNTEVYSTSPMVRHPLKERLYLSKGGIITGEYYDKWIIKSEIVENNKFIPPTPKIPVSIIYNTVNNNTYNVVCVDHREPKLKSLKDYYDCELKLDKKVKDMKLNIRKYKKLENHTKQYGI